MVTVKFFGLLRIKHKIRLLEVNTGTLLQVLDQVARKCPGLTAKDLQHCIIFLNKKELSSRKGYSLQLKDGDELSLLSPVSGG